MGRFPWIPDAEIEDTHSETKYHASWVCHVVHRGGRPLRGVGTGESQPEVILHRRLFLSFPAWNGKPSS